MTPRPAALYLRKSKDATTKASHLASLERLARLAGHVGPVTVYDYWARSGGRTSLAKRAAWQDLRAAIEDAPTMVYALDVGRTSRDIEETLNFERLVREHGGHFVTYDDDGTITDWTLPGNRDKLIETAHFADREWRKASRRARTTVEMRLARGDATTGGRYAPYGFAWVRAGDIGAEGDPRRIIEIPNPDEPLQPVQDAIRDTRGNFLAAVRLLNERGVPTRTGAPWNRPTLTRALERANGVTHARREKSDAHAPRRHGPSEAPLSRLVLCHCGWLMTPERDRRSKEWASLSCNHGAQLGLAAHGRYLARSRHVIDLLKSELHYLHIDILKSSPVDVSAERAKLEAQRRGLGLAIADAAIDPDEYRRRMDSVTRELAALNESEVTENEWVGVSDPKPVVDWNADDAAVGDALRRIVRSVKLDESMMPVADSIKWRAPWLAKRK